MRPKPGDRRCGAQKLSSEAHKTMWIGALARKILRFDIEWLANTRGNGLFRASLTVVNLREDYHLTNPQSRPNTRTQPTSS
jgi:hypothetical protein